MRVTTFFRQVVLYYSVIGGVLLFLAASFWLAGWLTPPVRGYFIGSAVGGAFACLWGALSDALMASKKRVAKSNA